MKKLHSTFTNKPLEEKETLKAMGYKIVSIQKKESDYLSMFYCINYYEQINVDLPYIFDDVISYIKTIRHIYDVDVLVFDMFNSLSLSEMSNVLVLAEKAINAEYDRDYREILSNILDIYNKAIHREFDI